MTEQRTPFSQLVAHLGKGSIDATATDELAELVQSVRETRKKGSITLQIDVAMLDKASENAVKMTAQVTSKPPKSELPATIGYSTYDGEILRDDPDQPALDLKQVEPPQTQFRKAPTGNRTVKTVGAES